MASEATFVSHPYYPKDLNLPHYVPNENGDFCVPFGFFLLVGFLAVLTWFYSGGRRRNFSAADRLKCCWFAVCALIHTLLEGYFSLYHETLAAKQSYLAQIWKEYGKGDSRYMTSDNFTVCMESITAIVDGPLSLMALIAFLRHNAYRYPLQLIVSLCQLYGCTLYFMTEYRDNFSHSEKWHPIYFWFYFVFMNLLWICIPLYLIIEATLQIGQAQSAVDRKPSPTNKKKTF